MTRHGDRAVGGCEECRQSDDGLEKASDDLHRTIFDRFRPSEPGHSLSYQNDFLYRCSACATIWLSQFWEIDTPETALEEWGITYRTRVALTAEDVMLIEETRESGRLLPHDTFRPIRD
jgi:hypothetical protein